MIKLIFLKRKRNKKTSKYIRRYGMTLAQIAEKFNTTPSTVFNWLKSPEKKNWLEKQLEILTK